MNIYHMVSGQGLGGPKQVYMDLHRMFAGLGYQIKPVVKARSAVASFHRDRSEAFIGLKGYIRRRFWLPSITVLRSQLPRKGLMIVHKPIDAWFVRRSCPDMTIVLIVHGYHHRGIESADYLIAVSDSVADYLRVRTQRPVVVIPNMLYELPDDQEMKISTPLQFGFLGFFRRKKGLTELCRAMRQLRGDYEVKIAGWGWIGYWLRFLKWFWQLDKLTIQPWVTDKQSWFDAIDVFVLPSRSETFGLVVLEALSRSKCVLATRSGGPSEIIQSGQNGWLVPTRSPDQLAQAMQSIIDDPKHMMAVRKDARLHVQRCYSRDVICQKWVDFLKRITTAQAQPEPCSTVQ